MRNADILSVKIEQADRLTNSHYGNPRYRLTFTRDGQFVATHNTMTDASCNYEVTNYLGHDGRLIDVWLTKRGTVEYMAEHR